MFKLFLEEGDQPTIRFYSTRDLCESLNKSRPIVESYLEDCATTLGSELFALHTYRGIVPDSKAKRPRTYFSEYIYDYIQQQIAIKEKKKTLYHQLPNDRRELKKIIVQLYSKFDKLINQSLHSETQMDIECMTSLHQKIGDGKPIKIMTEKHQTPHTVTLQLNDHWSTRNERRK